MRTEKTKTKTKQIKQKTLDILDLTHVYSRFHFFFFVHSRSLKCPLHIVSYSTANRSIRHGVVRHN